MANDQQPRIPLLRLYEKTSAKGNPYFTGKLNGCRVLVFRDDRAELSDGTLGIWNVFLQAPDDQQQRTGEGGDNGSRQERPRARDTLPPRYATDPTQHPDRPSDRGFSRSTRSRPAEPTAEPAFDDTIPF